MAALPAPRRRLVDLLGGLPRPRRGRAARPRRPAITLRVYALLLHDRAWSAAQVFADLLRDEQAS